MDVNSGNRYFPGEAASGDGRTQEAKNTVFAFAREAIIGGTSALRGFEMLNHCLLCS